MIEIAPIVPAHIDSFHHTLDTMARERRCLVMPEAPPLENPRSFVQDNISQGHAQFTALSDNEVVGSGAMPRRRGFRSIGMSAWVFFRHVADRASGVDGATT